MHGNPPGPIPTDDNNKPTLKTPDPAKIAQNNGVTINEKYDTKEDGRENEETLQYEEGFYFQVNSPSPA